MQAFAVFFWIARCCFDNPSTLKAKFYCHGTKETTSSSAVCVRAEVRSRGKEEGREKDGRKKVGRRKEGRGKEEDEKGQ